MTGLAAWHDTTFAAAARAGRPVPQRRPRPMLYHRVVTVPKAAREIAAAETTFIHLTVTFHQISPLKTASRQDAMMCFPAPVLPPGQRRRVHIARWRRAKASQHGARPTQDKQTKTVKTFLSSSARGCTVTFLATVCWGQSYLSRISMPAS